MLRLGKPSCKIVAAEPDGAALLSGKPYTGHQIQGWAPNFLPNILQAGREVIDSVVTVTDAEAIDMSRRLGRTEGILSGISGGGTIAAALKVAEKAPKGSVILAMISDTGERYMSTALFDGIDATSDPEPNTSAAEVPSGNPSS